MISTLVLLGTILLGRIIGEKAAKNLPAKKKAELVDAFSRSRLVSGATAIALTGGYFVLLKTQIVGPLVAFGIFSLVLLAFISTATVLGYKKLRDHDFPVDFVRSYLTAVSIRVIGMGLFFALVAKDMVL